jgi:exopolyphosphatase/guanosine-5'-triphosphate,3'-diphosphate pyrophosphatase
MGRLIGVIDLGTGSIKVSLFECVKDECKEIAFDSVDIRVVDQSTGMIGGDRWVSAIKIVKNLLAFGKNRGAGATVCIATHSMRTAKNSADFLREIKAECGVDVHVLSGNDEARLIGDSVRNIEGVDKFFSFDIGGGSVEFNLYDGIPIFSASKNIGAIGVANFISSKRMEQSLDGIAEVLYPHLRDIPHPTPGTEIICTGGCLAIGRRFLPVKDGRTVSIAALRDLFEKISPMSLDDMLSFGIPAGKVDIFAVAIGVVISILALIGHGNVAISSANVRHGVACNGVASKWNYDGKDSGSKS